MIKTPMFLVILAGTAASVACDRPYVDDVSWSIVAVHAGNTQSDNIVRVYEPHSTNGYVSSWTSAEGSPGSSVAVGDIDGDGDKDIAVGDPRFFGARPLNRLYRNDGGTFSVAWTDDGLPTLALRWGDVDDDGDPDLLRASFGSIILHRNTAGQLSAGIDLLPTSGGFDVDVADVDGDDDQDMVVAGGTEPTRIYTNNGGGGFEPTPWTDTGTVVSVKFGDYDADGDIDLAVGRVDGFVIYRADGTTMVGATYSASLQPSFTQRTNVNWIDFDGDDDLDLVAGHCTAIVTGDCDDAGPVRIYENQGGVFALAWTSPVTEKTTSVAIEDFNSDGNPDLLLGNYQAPLRLYQNTGGTFVPTWTSTESEYTTAVGGLLQVP